MKKLFVSALLLSSLLFTACGNNESKTGGEPAATESAPEKLPSIAPAFSNVDAGVVAGIHEVLQHYYHVQSALANDDAAEAGNGGKAMEEAITKMDKTAMNAEQKTLYEKNEADLRMHATHIQNSAHEIKHQREHFEKMSEGVYNLVKGFGAGKPVYKTFCPMAFNNKGAYWISAGTDVKNPYMGKDMLTCGEVKEVIKY